MVQIIIDDKVYDLYQVAAQEMQVGDIAYSVDKRRKFVIKMFEVIGKYETHMSDREIIRLIQETGYISQNDHITFITDKDEPVWVPPRHVFYVLGKYGQKIERPE